jgi:small conductance mechanosensitive channel
MFGPLKHNIVNLARLALVIAAVTIYTSAHGQENGGGVVPPPAATDSGVMDEPVRAFDTELTQIAEWRTNLSELYRMREGAEGLNQTIANAKITRLLERVIALVQSTAKAHAGDKRQQGDQFQPDAAIVALVDSLSEDIDKQLTYIQTRLILPAPDQTALENSALIADLETSAIAYDKLIDALIANNAIAAQLNMDTATAEQSVKRQVARGADNASIYLDVTMAQLQKLRHQLTTLPKNEELIAKIAVTEKHMGSIATILRKRAKRMDELGLDTTEINAQLIAATGAITAEILNVSVITGIAGKFLDSISSWISDNGARLTFQFLIFVIILVITWKIAQLSEMLTKRALGTMNIRLTQLLQRMIVSAARSVILILGLLIGLSQLGISLGPLLTGLGIAGFIIGFALQDSLSNFASGLMILVYRPFDVGDVVDVNGAFGTVRQMSLVNTTVLTFDNQTLVVPNNQVWQNIIKNLTSQTTRRVDLVFGISYADDIEKAERVLNKIVADDDRILEQPAPIVRLHELADSSVNFVVRPWVKTADYWETYWAITREVKMRFDREGISIPFPQRDVHLFTQAQGAQE